MPREYSQAGVDYTKIEPFKQAMQTTGKRTLNFPNQWGVYINQEAGDIFEYHGPHKPLWHMIQEGLGNKNWIAEWMYQHVGYMSRITAEPGEGELEIDNKVPWVYYS